MGAWVSNTWVWNFEWKAELTDIETETALDLQLILHEVQPRMGVSDRRRWILNNVGSFSVKSVYNDLLNRSGVLDLEHNTVKALQSLWMNHVPSK
ncbi:hypothetical protein A2U01_0042219, partial [Trifolium medium]|nr:hypothetical protein [Trifolium medium]